MECGSAGGGSGYIGGVTGGSMQNAATYGDGTVRITCTVAAPPVMMRPNISGTWRSSSGVWTNVGGTWRSSSSVKSNVSGTWR
jgi:hypothetical protein